MWFDYDQDRECRFGIECKYLPQDRCFNFHPEWQKQMFQNQQANTSGKRPCRYGDDCSYLKKGQCWFYHPPQHRNKKKTNSSSGIFGMLSTSIKNQNSLQAQFRRQQQLRKEKEERERKQRELQLARLRQIERERERERQRQRLAELRERLQLARTQRCQQKKKLTEKQFEWYFSKNNTFKACEISEEKLQHLDHCIICFISFVENPEDEVKPEQKFESKEYLQRDLTELYCKHTFHTDCIKKWLHTNSNCPVCRKDFQDHLEYKKWEEEKRQLALSREQKPETTRFSAFGQVRFTSQRSTTIADLLRRFGWDI